MKALSVTHIYYMDRGVSIMKMDTVIKEGSRRGKGMDRGSGYTIGEGATRGDGKMVGDMGKEEKQTNKEDTEKECGRGVRGQLGCIGTTTNRGTCSRYMIMIKGKK